MAGVFLGENADVLYGDAVMYRSNLNCRVSVQEHRFSPSAEINGGHMRALTHGNYFWDRPVRERTFLSRLGRDSRQHVVINAYFNDKVLLRDYTRSVYIALCNVKKVRFQ